MNCIKKIYYNIFYKNSAMDVMGALTNSEAYNNYKQTLEKIEVKTKNKLNSFINEIDYDIRSAVMDGNLSMKREFTTKLITKQHIKYLKKLYKEKGYRIYIFWPFKSKKTLIISWKHCK